MDEKGVRFTGCQYYAVEVKRTGSWAIYELNRQNVHGIMVYYPAFGTNARLGGRPRTTISLRASKRMLKGSASPICRRYKNKRSLQNARGDPVKSVLPRTPRVVVKIPEYLGVYVDEKKASVDRGEGKPSDQPEPDRRHLLAVMLANDGAQVTQGR